MTYEIWPGIGLSDEPVEWAKVLGSPTLSTKSTANVERRRNAGTDTSTIRGISKKSERSPRTAPKTMRRPKNPGGKRGPGSGAGMREDSWSGKIRAALAYGPMTRGEICAVTGARAKCISAYLKNDVRQGRILKIVKPDSLQKFALVEAE